MSSPASAQRRMNSSACTSEPPASSSSRSRHASTWTRRTPGCDDVPHQVGNVVSAVGARHRSAPYQRGRPGRRHTQDPRAAVGPRDAFRAAAATNLRSPMAGFPPTRLIAAFSDAVIVHDLPALPADRRAEVVAFAGRRIAGLPSPMKLGVGVVAIVVGASRTARRAHPPRAAARHASAPGGRRLRAPRPLARLRLRLGDVAGDQARREPPLDSAVRFRHTSDVLVVGSGAGGAPTAALLAEAGSRRARRRGGRTGPAGRRRAVLAGADGPAVPRRWRHGRDRAPVDRLHRGVLCRWRHARSTPGSTAARPRTCSSGGERSTGSPTSTPASCTRSATRSKRDLSVQTRARPADPGQRSAPPRRARTSGGRTTRSRAG